MHNTSYPYMPYIKTSKINKLIKQLLYLSNLHSSLKETVATKDSATQANYLSVTGGQCCLYIITSLTFSHHYSCLSLLSKNVCAWVIGLDTFFACFVLFIQLYFLPFHFSFFLRVTARSESLWGDCPGSYRQ